MTYIQKLKDGFIDRFYLAKDFPDMTPSQIEIIWSYVQEIFDDAREKWLVEGNPEVFRAWRDKLTSQSYQKGREDERARLKDVFIKTFNEREDDMWVAQFLEQLINKK